LPTHLLHISPHSFWASLLPKTLFFAPCEWEIGCGWWRGRRQAGRVGQ
jgi:hypothetical protein